MMSRVSMQHILAYLRSMLSAGEEKAAEIEPPRKQSPATAPPDVDPNEVPQEVQGALQTLMVHAFEQTLRQLDRPEVLEEIRTKFEECGSPDPNDPTLTPETLLSKMKDKMRSDLQDIKSGKGKWTT